MKLVLEDGYLRGEGAGEARDIEVVGVKFCEYSWDGWLSAWMGREDEMPTERWLIDQAHPIEERVRIWSAKDDIEHWNWTYEGRRLSIMEDDD